MTLTEAVKAEARRLGFSLVGVTTPDPPSHLDAFTAWLAAGRQGEMAYLATERSRQRRADPRQILPACQSILVLGMPYDPPEAAPSPAEADPTGQVAAYAWGEDYHLVIGERLAALIDFIEAHAGQAVPNRYYTDTGPVLERELAQRAGLGWIGKNTCLINPHAGSYFLLAEVLLGLGLDPDPPFLPDRCGACTRCLEVCPTGCILPDRTIDARRCISYLTIELKGAIPADLRPFLGNWVFGCDVCQQVCPWNRRFAAPAGDPALAARPGTPAPRLAEEISLTPQAFNHKFHRSPVKRAKRRGYLRNVAVAFGNAAGNARGNAADNVGSGAALPALAGTLHDPEPLVRGHAAWALGQVGDPKARQWLEDALRNEADPAVQAEIRSALNHPA